jgi:hypothetical protein
MQQLDNGWKRKLQVHLTRQNIQAEPKITQDNNEDVYIQIFLSVLKI